MAGGSSRAVGRIGLEQLIALNDEIAALVRVGVPLEQGLGLLGRDLPGRLGKIAAGVAAQLEQGRSLPDVLADPAWDVPPVYRAVVRAGLRSGRLSGALESVACSAGRLAEMRKHVAAALLYPLVVVLLAWGLFVLYVARVAPAFASAFAEFRVPGREVLASIAAWGPSLGVWGPLVPVVVVGLALVWWWSSERTYMFGARGWPGLLAWVPGLGRILQSAQTATFAELVALLVENRAPLDEAVSLAGAATDRGRFAQAAAEFAAALRGGQFHPELTSRKTGLPPLLQWILASRQQTGDLALVLRRAADMYRQRLLYQTRLAEVFLPVVLTLLVGGGATLAYALLVFVPYIGLLSWLAAW